MKRRPAIGTRVMRPYGRKDFATYGELGVISAHNDNGTFQMTLDADQPFARAMWGAKAKRTDHGGTVHAVLNPSEVEPLSAVYRDNARRFRSVAKTWDAAARAVSGSGDPS